ncbi:MAG: SDR family oxidoreductase [Candidatus Latescibacterota bacterium]|nr:MAG: SDR family oxidoreductase [Candidatus Latescibacterota bacterium]
MLPHDTFRDKCVLVTGGGTGLGLATARQFADLGARLVIASRKREHLEPAAAELRERGAEVLPVVTDVRRPGSVSEMVEAALERFGSIEVLINNAAGNFLAPAEELSPGGWKVVIDIALNGVFYCTREVGLHMIERGYGRIVNVVATYAWTGGPGTVHSAAAKAGVVAMTRTLAVEWARHGVRVNAVCPGLFDSQGARERLWPSAEAQERLRRSVPLQRFASTREVADAITYLASPYADYVNGEVLVIDAGMHLGRGLGRS